jgi:Mn-dependent DtxR family transcriptional regulator
MNYTNKQVEIVNAIVDFKNRNDYYPTYRELAKILKISIGSVQQRIECLEKKGVVYKIPNIARNIRIKDNIK